MSNVLLYLLIPLGMLVTTVVLGIGIYSLAKGGKFAKDHSNRLMRLRVMAQGITIALLALFVFLIQQGQ